MSVTQQRRQVRQRPKGPVDAGPGRRVRTLRLARNLTQAALAGRDFSKGFISLVESGRTRMSLRAAEIIATKLDVSVGELLAPESGKEIELALLHAESRLREGDVGEALRLVDAVESRLGLGVQRARVLRLKGRALSQR